MKAFSSSVVRPLLAATRPATIVEVGAEAGGHTKQLVEWASGRGATVHVVDPGPGTAVRALAALKPKACVVHRELSLEALPKIERPDVVLLDGDHNWYTVYEELKLVERGGERWPVVLLHDISWPWGRRDLYYLPETIPAEARRPSGAGGIVRGRSALSQEGGFSARREKALHEGGPRNGVLTAIEDFMGATSLDLQLFAVAGPGGLGILLERRRLDEDRELADVVRRVRDDDFALRLSPGYASRYFEPAPEVPAAAPQPQPGGVLRLGWDELPAGREYRVLVRDVTAERYIVKQPVEAAGYDLSLEKLDPSHLYRWRVQGRDSPEARWRDVFPELLLPEDPSPEASELRTAVHAPANGDGHVREDGDMLTWTPVDSPAYRVTILDHETADVVVTDAVQGSSYAVDWSKLDPRRWWSYRVQVLKEGGWADLLKYGTLHPPVERLPRRASPAGQAVKVAHVVLTRFSLRTSGVGFRDEWPPGWLEGRLELFERYAVPSMKGQTTQDYTWVVFCDPVTPDDVVERLRGFSDRITVAECRRGAGLRGTHPDDLRDIGRYVDPGAEVVISTRLDSDDALNRQSLEQIQSHARAFLESSQEHLLHTFPLGCKLDAVNRAVYRSRYQQNAFLSLFERPGSDVQGVMRDSHTRLEKLFPIERDFSLLGWLQVLHGGNVSNHLNRGDVATGGLDLDAMFGVPAAT